MTLPRLFVAAWPPSDVLDDIEARSAAVRREPGDTVLLYTDGITEAESPDGEEYGLERLSDCVARNTQSAPEEIAIAIDIHGD